MRKSLSMYIFQYLFYWIYFYNWRETAQKFHDYLFRLQQHRVGFLTRLCWDKIASAIPLGLSDRHAFPCLSVCKKCPLSNFELLARVIF